MKNVELNWKEFNVDLEALRAEIDSLVPGKCLGISADSNLRIHMNEETSQEEIDSILLMWEELDEESEMAASYRSQEQIKQAIETMKAGIPAKTWANMSAIERGILIGQIPTKAQLIEEELL